MSSGVGLWGAVPGGMWGPCQLSWELRDPQEPVPTVPIHLGLGVWAPGSPSAKLGQSRAKQSDRSCWELPTSHRGERRPGGGKGPLVQFSHKAGLWETAPHRVYFHPRWNNNREGEKDFETDRTTDYGEM